MEVIWQYDPRLNLERAFGFGQSHGLAQVFDVADQCVAVSVGQCDGEKDKGALDFRAYVGGHGVTYDGMVNGA
jgi:hypothetical protein